LIADIYDEFLLTGREFAQFPVFFENRKVPGQILVVRLGDKRFKFRNKGGWNWAETTALGRQSRPNGKQKNRTKGSKHHHELSNNAPRCVSIVKISASPSQYR